MRIGRWLGVAVAGVLAAGVGAVGARAAALATHEGLCFLIVKQDGGFRMVAQPGFHLLAGPDQLVATPPAGTELATVECLRDSIIPDERDDRVLSQLHVPLYLGRVDGSATLILEISGGKVRARMLIGDLTRDEKRLIGPRLDLFQHRLAATAPQGQSR